MSVRRRKRYTKEQKRELVERFRESGMNATRFCKQQRVSYPSLKSWLASSQVQKVQFVEVAQAERPQAQLRVALPNGLHAEFPLHADKPVVADWIRELKSC